MAEQPTPSQSDTQPVFGQHRMVDFRQRPSEEPQFITVGVDAWMYDSPSWDPKRIRLGRVDKPTATQILQTLEHPRDAAKPNKRTSLEVLYRWTGKDGTPRESRFWVNTSRNGFEGMPRPERIGPQPTLEI